jgi:hypothetical protein
MPARFEIDKVRRLVRSFAWGTVTLADFLQNQRTLRTHPEFNPDFDQISDYSEITSVAISAEEVQLLAHQTLFSTKSRLAFVAPSKLAFGMVRMFEAYHELSSTPSNTMVFTNVSEALAWLNRSGVAPLSS